MKQMFEITYVKTGSGENKKLRIVNICTCDEKKNGENANNIIGVIELFEEKMEDLGTYENRNAIVEMKVIRECKEAIAFNKPRLWGANPPQRN